MSLLGKRKRERRITREQLPSVQAWPISQSNSNDHDDSSVESNEEDVETGSEEGGQEDVRSIFARHFNQQFQPLVSSSSSSDKRKPKSHKSKGIVIEDLRDNESEDANQLGDNGDSEDFSGFEDDAEDTVQVVEHSLASNNASDINGISARDKRAFMSSKPPSSTTPSISSSKPTTNTKDTDDQESQNLKNDLALQRLLSESHLLHSSSSFQNSPESQSATSQAIHSSQRNLRHKTTDLRLSSLGAHKSILDQHQQKMPASHLKGIREKSKQKEILRRKEAKENGIVLERPGKLHSSGGSSGGGGGGNSSTGKAKGKGTSTFKGKRNPRGLVGDAKIGKFSGATLTLSRGDLAEIKGSTGKFDRGPKKKGKRGGMKGRRY